MEKINSKRYQEITYDPSDEIWFDADEVGMPFSFDVSQELTAEKEKMDVIGDFLDHIEDIMKIAMDTFVHILKEPNHPYYETVSFFLTFHRDEFEEEELDDLFGIEQAKELSLDQIVFCLHLNRLGCDMDDEMNEQIFILDFTFNTDLTDEILVVYFSGEKEIIAISHES